MTYFLGARDRDTSSEVLLHLLGMLPGVVEEDGQMDLVQMDLVPEEGWEPRRDNAMTDLGIDLDHQHRVTQTNGTGHRLYCTVPEPLWNNAPF